MGGGDEVFHFFPNLSELESQRLFAINEEVNDLRRRTDSLSNEKNTILANQSYITSMKNLEIDHNDMSANIVAGTRLRFLILPSSMAETGHLEEFQLEFANENAHDLIIGINFPYQQIGQELTWTNNGVLRIKDTFHMKSCPLLFQLHTARLFLAVKTPFQLVAWVKSTMQHITSNEKILHDILASIKSIAESPNITRAAKNVLFLIANGWQQDQSTKKYSASNVIDAMHPKLGDPTARDALVSFFKIVIFETVGSITFLSYCLISNMKHISLTKKSKLKMIVERNRRLQQ